jgi:hypothetical protein
MAYGLKEHESNIFAGLGTCTYTVKTAGAYFVSSQTTTVPPSGLVTVINLNGSPQATSISTDPSEKTVGVSAVVGCQPGDVITVVLTSSTYNDQLLNTLKTTIVLNNQGA